MSFLSGIGHVLGNVGTAIKKGVVDTGHTVGNVADNKWTKTALAAGLAATGVGAPAAAAIMAANGLAGGALHEGGGFGDAVKGGVTGAVSGYGAGKAGGLLRSALGAAPAITGGGATPGAPSGDAGIDGAAPASYNPVDASQASPGGTSGGGGFWDSILHGVEGAGSGIVSGAGSLLRGALGGNGTGGLSLPTAALTAAQIANAASLGKKANDYADTAMNDVRSSYDARAPLRTAGITGLLTPHPEQSLTGLTAIRNQNPAAKRALAQPLVQQPAVSGGFA